MEILIQAGCNLDVQNNRGRTALMRSHDSLAEELEWREVNKAYEVLINAGCNINLQTNEGTTALVEACVANDEYKLRDLVQAKRDLYSKTNDCQNALKRAILLRKEYSDPYRHDWPHPDIRQEYREENQKIITFLSEKTRFLTEKLRSLTEEIVQSYFNNNFKNRCDSIIMSTIILSFI